MAAIELKDVERRYGERVALSGVSATVGEGETLTVLGPNGAGKSTLLTAIAVWAFRCSILPRDTAAHG